MGSIGHSIINCASFHHQHVSCVYHNGLVYQWTTYHHHHHHHHHHHRPRRHHHHHHQSIIKSSLTIYHQMSPFMYHFSSSSSSSSASVINNHLSSLIIIWLVHNPHLVTRIPATRHWQLFSSTLGATKLSMLQLGVCLRSAKGPHPVWISTSPDKNMVKDGSYIFWNKKDMRKSSFLSCNKEWSYRPTLKNMQYI